MSIEDFIMLAPTPPENSLDPDKMKTVGVLLGA
jgi:hypothetical protein